MLGPLVQYFLTENNQIKIFDFCFESVFSFENNGKKLILEPAVKVQSGIFSLWGKRQSTAYLRHRQFRLET